MPVNRNTPAKLGVLQERLNHDSEILSLNFFYLPKKIAYIFSVIIMLVLRPGLQATSSTNQNTPTPFIRPGVQLVLTADQHTPFHRLRNLNPNNDILWTMSDAIPAFLLTENFLRSYSQRVHWTERELREKAVVCLVYV